MGGQISPSELRLSSGIELVTWSLAVTLLMKFEWRCDASDFDIESLFVLRIKEFKPFQLFEVA